MVNRRNVLKGTKYNFAAKFVTVFRWKKIPCVPHGEAPEPLRRLVLANI
jgi:hypothetical protein